MSESAHDKRSRDAKANDAHAHKPKQHATAGPSQDDRFGAGPAASNLLARIIRHDVSNDRLRIAIARGREHGVRLGMEGYVKTGIGMLCEFQIDEVKTRVSYAFIDVTTKELGGHHTVVINPSSKPRVPAPWDLRTRVIGVGVEGGQTKIDLARGSAHGVRAGLRGHLLSADGREGPDFEIGLALPIRSVAYLTATVDQVNQHQLALINPSESRTASSPVQRRATGVATIADVQPTAQAGVAGAASPLPHLETIQRSFGKHDVSGVQAQVGGPATQATQALGAQAYATGNKVAFASAPDLHTAAHEAAHTIQQKHGAVGFQGLGAADDTHERHADQVADAVVAGQSAEPLLDQVAGVGPANAGAVQRKPADAVVRGGDDIARSVTGNSKLAPNGTGHSGDAYIDHGPACEVKSDADCFLTSDQRARLIQGFKGRLVRAETNYKNAATEVRVDKLLEKEDDIHWIVGLAVDLAVGHIVSRISGSLISVKNAKAAELQAMANELAWQQQPDPRWLEAAQKALRKLGDDELKAGVKLAMDGGKKLGTTAAKTATNEPAKTNRSEALDYIAQLKDAASKGFARIEEQVPATATDAELVALWKAFHINDHLESQYKAGLIAKLQRFEHSKVSKIGRRHEQRAQDMMPVERDVYVVRLEYLSGYPARLAFRHHDGMRTMQGGVLGRPQPESLPMRLGPTLPATKTARSGVSDDPKAHHFVPDEFVKMATLRHEQMWGHAPTTEMIDDSGWWWEPERAKAAQAKKGNTASLPIQPDKGVAPTTPAATRSTSNPPASDPVAIPDVFRGVDIDTGKKRPS